MMNPHEQLARLRKSQHIALLTWAKLLPEERRNPNLPKATATMEDDWWADISASAGHSRPPSIATREAVLLELSRMVTAERRCAPEPCAHCEGHGTQWTRTCPHDEGCYGGCSQEYAVEDTCSRCDGSGHEPCSCCGEPDRVGTVVTPEGLWSVECCEQSDYGALARHARLVADPFSALRGVG